jgi:hypothetical protein
VIPISTIIGSSSKIIKIVMRKTWKTWKTLKFWIQIRILFWMIAFEIITPDAKTKMITNITIRFPISKSRFFDHLAMVPRIIFILIFEDSTIWRFEDSTIRDSKISLVNLIFPIILIILKSHFSNFMEYFARSETLIVAY